MIDHPSPQPARRHYVAIFVLSLSVLMLEIAVARILSVALFSHYAFVAISLAMFGLGLSALVVYLLPARFPVERIDRQLTTYAALFGLSACVSVILFMHVRVVQEVSIEGFLTLGLAYVLLAVPFFLGGLCIALLMTHFSADIARIYYADLTGASLGCLAVVGALSIAPAPTVALVVGVLVTGTALLFARASAVAGARLPTVAAAIAVAVLLLAATTDIGTLRYIKGWAARYADYEGWNAFSRVSAFQVDRNAAQLVPLPQPNDAYADEDYPASMMLDIDGAAWTPMMNFNGDISTIQFLRESVLYIAHHLKPGADVLVIGAGGGRDLLAALAFQQQSVLGMEINPLMRRIVEDRFGAYSGRPYSSHGVEVIIDEARSRLTSLDRRFDVIQLSLIDTFSLNAAGGFVFSENYLYTKEGFQEYFHHLTPDGIVSLTRHFVPRYPVEILRLAAIARAAWEAEGIERFRDHAIVLRQGMSATMLTKRSPYTAEEVRLAETLAETYKMQMLYAPGMGVRGHPDITAILTAEDWGQYVADHEFVIDPTTDDRPFFFNFLRQLIEPPGLAGDPFRFLKLWNDALLLMYMLIAVVTTLAVLFFIAPLFVLATTARLTVAVRVAVPLLLYFVCLGYGFLMIEIPLLQRFVLLLGYPAYSLAVVLFALLLFSGLGSLLSNRFAARPQPALLTALAAIIAIGLLYVVALPAVIPAVLGTPILLRIIVTVLLLAPIGLPMGMAYPLGIAVLRGHDPNLVPWAWGLNGAMSVVASVLATFLGSNVGFNAALLTGVAAYVLGLLSIAVVIRLRDAADLAEENLASDRLRAGERV